MQDGELVPGQSYPAQLRARAHIKYVFVVFVEIVLVVVPQNIVLPGYPGVVAIRETLDAHSTVLHDVGLQVFGDRQDNAPKAIDVTNECDNWTAIDIKLVESRRRVPMVYKGVVLYVPDVEIPIVLEGVPVVPVVPFAYPLRRWVNTP